MHYLTHIGRRIDETCLLYNVSKRLIRNYLGYSLLLWAKVEFSDNDILKNVEVRDLNGCCISEKIFSAMGAQ